MNQKMEGSKQEVSKNLRLLAKTSIFVLFSVIISKILSYSYRIIVARFFGPEVYGIFSLAILIIGIFITFSLIGFSDGLTRYISMLRGKKRLKDISSLINSSLIVSMSLSIIICGILFVSSDFISINFFHNENLSLFLKILSFTIPLSVFSSILLSIIKSFEKIYIYSFFVNIVNNLTKLVILLILIFLGVNESAIIFSYFLGVLSLVVGPYLFSKRYLPQVIFSNNISLKSKNFKEMLEYSWPIMFFGALSGVLYWIDSIMIGYFLGVESVGFYNAAIPLVALLWVAPDIFIQLFFPLITKEFSRGKLKLVEDLSKQVNKWILIINLPIFFIMILFPGVLINLLFGAEYLVAENSLRILAVGGIFISIGAISSSILSSLGKSKLILANIISASILNFLLNIILIPIYGLEGAAIATSTSAFFLNITLLLEVYYIKSIISLRRKMFRIIVISILPLVVLFYIKEFIPKNLISLILSFSALVFVYIILILLTNSLDENDLNIIRAIKEKFIPVKIDKNEE